MKIALFYNVIVWLILFGEPNDCSSKSAAKRRDLRKSAVSHQLHQHPKRHKLRPFAHVIRNQIPIGVRASESINDDVVGERIIGGSDVAVSNAWPWQASLQMLINGTYWHICGASILSAKCLLTAGHCVNEQDARDLRVVVGLSNLQNTVAAQVSNVTSYEKHPNYNSSTTTIISDDIAIIILQTPIVQNANVAFTRLPSDPGQPFAGATCTMTGWGRNSGDDNLPMMLQQADTTVMNRVECSSHLAGLPINNTSQICVEDLSGSIGPCNGDSGGPLNCPDENGGFYVCGITSWGISIRDSNTGKTICLVAFPSIYTRVTAYLRWINEILATYH